MHNYEITFYRHLVNSSGFPFKSNLMTVRVANCADQQQAFRQAARRFEYNWSVYEWRNLADEYEIQEERKGPTSH